MLLVWHSGFSQFSDDFSDGDLQSGTIWGGDTADFVDTAGELQLAAAPVTGNSYLVTSSQSINEAEWKIRVGFDFNPSSSNYAEIYLVADQSGLDSALQGYFVQVGSTQDDICLYRKDGSDKVKIIDGIDGRLSLSMVDVQIRIRRSAAGIWSLSSQLSGETVFTEEGMFSDATYYSTAYFGINCVYTTTRADKFSFDDILVTGQPYVDTNPPLIDTVYTISATDLIIITDEPLAAASILPATVLLNDSELPETMEITSNKVILHFANSLPVFNSITIWSWQDSVGNPMPESSRSFIHYSSEPVLYGDIAINELLTDPTPVEDLPESEYLEIINTTNKAIYMTDWSLSDRNTVSSLPNMGLLPDSTVVFCPAAKANLFTGANIYGLSKWPSLNNESDSITLSNRQGQPIDIVRYDVGWLGDATKMEGGWSLERKDPGFPCSLPENWGASISPSGGTPGQQNSIFSAFVDSTPPLIQLAIALSSDSVMIIFTEPLSGEMPLLSIDGQPVDYGVFNDLFNQEMLITGLALEKRIEYHLKATGIADCSGNVTASDEAIVVLTEEAASGDIVVSEILFNPRDEGSDFVEFYNQSARYIDLLGWYVNDRQVIEHLILYPNHYFALTDDPQNIIDEYPGAKVERLIEFDLPAFPNASGTVVLKNSPGVSIDSIIYREDWHFNYLDDVEGVSLERLRFDQPAVKASFWASASATDHYATPGYRNTQEIPGDVNNPLSCRPQVIVPDANGLDDFSIVRVELGNADALVTVDVFNLNGQPIRRLANNELANTFLETRWDGTDDRGSIVPLGHYLVVAHLFYDDGRTKTYRQKLVVGTGF